MGSRRTWKPNARSALLNDAPSCHLMLGRSFQVISMPPSGVSRHVPRSVDGRSCARRGSIPVGVLATSSSTGIRRTASPPPDAPAPVPARSGSKFGISRCTPIVRVFGPVDRTL